MITQPFTISVWRGNADVTEVISNTCEGKHTQSQEFNFSAPNCYSLFVHLYYIAFRSLHSRNGIKAHAMSMLFICSTRLLHSTWSFFQFSRVDSFYRPWRSLLLRYPAKSVWLLAGPPLSSSVSSSVTFSLVPCWLMPLHRPRCSAGFTNCLSGPSSCSCSFVEP